ncbi:hypothetical protein HU200_018887 [Digitaria exilis]|uniref:Uncharacterized protein n=1 Tax=Digitaria exilis TaxID=1010633 RepID=A0A835F419_9POAL|nr:hypothetical protein HU200_018887 [Digitaria exilis]
MPNVAGEPWQACGDTGNYEPQSSYLTSINSIAATLPGNASASPDLFATAVAGNIPEQVSALGLCRGDANATSCSSCLAQAFRTMPDTCPSNKDAALFYDNCMLHYSNIPFLHDDGFWPIGVVAYLMEYFNFSVKSEPERFNLVVAALLNATADYAANNSTRRATADYAAHNSTRRYAAGEADMDLPDFPKLYSWAQCTPDLTPARCRRCLAAVIAQLPQLYPNSSVGMVLGVRCSVRYQTDSFMDGPVMVRLAAPAPAPAPAAILPSATPKPGEGRRYAVKKRRAAGIIAGVLCSVVIILILSVFAFVYRRNSCHIATALKKITRVQCMIFDFPTLQDATENFSENNKIGEGGFGTVYKGILSDGQKVAVKKLLGSTGNGLHQLHNEILVLAELQHKNLVRLQGFCLHREETLLVYEYIENGSLDNFLFVDDSGENELNWEQRYNIILGIAKGTRYLHEESSTRIIHRDLKANNILLEEDMDPKIADFGLAKLLGEDHTDTKTTRVVGTFGYMAPEYAIDGIVSAKIDIFSFGVLVLEIVTGRKNSSSESHDTVNLLSDVWNCWTKGTVSGMIEQSLDGYFRWQALRCVHIGLLCVQPDPNDRPLISSVVSMLTRENMEFPPPAQPAFYFGRESNLPSPSCGQRNYAYHPSSVEGISVNEVTFTEPYTR